MNKTINMLISQISTGFSEVPNEVSINIYATGCKRKCEGCQNPDLLSDKNGQYISSAEIDKILNDYPASSWVCWLGGDALYQSESLNEFNRKFKDRSLKVCLYTGELWENIKQELLENIDLVIDGPWKGKTIKEKGTNQRIFLKTVDGWQQKQSWDDLTRQLTGELK